MDYPSGNEDLVTAFYDESERLVRFLIATDKEKFPQFLELSAAGQPFDVALFHTSGAKFTNVAELEEKFFEYAAAEAAIASQDQ